jgi:putative spermidine/putrescine transport system substrate-binding protein
MARETDYVVYGPTRMSAMKYVKPDALPALPSAPQNMKNALSRNEEWWADHFQEVNEKWTVWLSKLKL